MSPHQLATELAVSQRKLSNQGECAAWIAQRFGRLSDEMFAIIHANAQEIRDALDAQAQLLGVTAPADVAWEG